MYHTEPNEVDDRLDRKPDARDDLDLNVEHNAYHTYGGFYLKMT